MAIPEVIANQPLTNPLPRHAPRVLIPACNRPFGQHPYHMVGQKYVDAVRLVGAMPVVVPAAHPDELDNWLDMADGILLTGSPSNVHPSHFNADVHDPSLPLDPMRDRWTLPLIRLAVARGLPLLAICRGFQETNVALGGSLHQAVHQCPGMRDHRAPSEAEAVAVQYGVAHSVSLQPDGLLAQLLRQPHIEVNSLHGQGIDRLAQGTRIEATAPDGLVEAFTVTQSPGFALCVQWHPEWQAASNPVSMALFGAFGKACAAWRDRHHRPPPSP